MEDSISNEEHNGRGGLNWDLISSEGHNKCCLLGYSLSHE